MPPWHFVSNRHICAVPHFATCRAIIVQYLIETSTKEFCDTNTTSITRYETYRCSLSPGEAAKRHNQEFNCSMEEWKAQVESQGFKDHPAIPFGPPPKETSSMRVLPDVHDALRQTVPRLQGRSQSSRKPLQQAEADQQLSIQEMNLDSKDWYNASAASTTTQASKAVGCAASGNLPSTDTYSHDFRQSTSSTRRCASKANASRDESGNSQASIASTSSTGSAQQASTTQGIST